MNRVWKTSNIYEIKSNGNGLIKDHDSQKLIYFDFRKIKKNISQDYLIKGSPVIYLVELGVYLDIVEIRLVL